MQVVHQRCCGLDVHKKVVVACLSVLEKNGTRRKEIRSFSTMTSQLLQLLDWLKAEGCTHLAMESTGVYWKPIFNLLEGELEVLLVNAAHIKAVPGRKTDVKDSEWIADLLQHGLLRASFIPPAPQRQLRDLTRYRSSLVADRAQLLNRIHKLLEDTNLKLGSVVTDISGVSGRAILERLSQGEAQIEELLPLTKGRLRTKQAELELALEGNFSEHHRFVLSKQLAQLTFLDEQIEAFNQEISSRIVPTKPVEEETVAFTLNDQEFKANQETGSQTSLEQALAWLDTIPGINRRIGEIILAEIGLEVERFPTAGHLASWAGVCPGNHQSAGKHKSGRTTKGNRWLKQALIEAAQGAMHTRSTYLSAQGKRLTKRIGKKKALVAVAHTIVVMIYYVLQRGEPYSELGSDYFDKRDEEAIKRGAVRRLERLGYAVTLEAKSASEVAA